MGMNELEVIIEQEPGSVSWNFEELKEALTDALQVYKTMVYDDNAIPAAKADVAMLRKLKKAVESKRVEVKKKCLEPYDVLEGQAKELCSIIDEPIRYITGRVSEYEEEQRAARRAEIIQYMDAATKDLDTGVAKALRSMRYDRRWENKTTARKTWQTEIDTVARTARIDTEFIMNFPEEFQEDCMSLYRKTLDIRRVMEKAEELQDQKERILEAERRRKEAEKLRAMEQQREEAEKATQRAHKLNSESARPVDAGSHTEESARPIRGSHGSSEARAQAEEKKPEPTLQNIEGAHRICIYADSEKYQKILGYIRFLGVSYEEL